MTEVAELLLRQCKKCGERKPYSEFYYYMVNGNGYFRRQCKKCISTHMSNRYASDVEGFREKTREWQKRNSEKVALSTRNTKLKLTYGLTTTLWWALFEGQDKRCANPLCRVDEPKGQYWHTDHDHKTGKVRGILCQSCNRALGAVDDDTEKLRGLIKYLNRSRGITDEGGNNG